MLRSQGLPEESVEHQAVIKSIYSIKLRESASE